MSTAGFYGKIASRGDFLGRDLPQSFIQPWDAWLAEGLAASQQQLGDAWLDTYLVSPLWHFLLAPGVCGDQAVAGVLMPSIDRVGRYFPLVIASLLPADQSPASVVSDDTWFEAAEALLLTTLEEGARFEDFETAVQALGPLPVRSRVAQAGFAGLQRIEAVEGSARLDALADLSCEGVSLWWGKGSERIDAGLMRCHGLPPANEFGQYLLGREATC